MKKKISIGTTVAVALLAALLSFQITFLAAMSIKEKAGSDASEKFIYKAADRLSMVDAAFRSQYLDADELDDDLLIDYMLKGYIAATGDRYAEYYTMEEYADFMSDITGDSEGIGVSVISSAEMQAIEIVSVIPDSPAEAAGIKAGDLVVYLGEGDEKESVAELGYTAALSKLVGKAGTEAVFTVLRRDGDNSESIEFKVMRQKIDSVSVYSHVYSLDESIGVVLITGFDLKTPSQFKSAVQSLLDDGCDKFVMDVRSNPGGELSAVVDILDFLLPEGPIIRIFDKNGEMVEEHTSDSDFFDYPIAVITNSGTASAAELFTSALRDYERSVTVGNTTYGKGCMQTIMGLADGSALKVTYRMFKPPFSESYHGIGIVPDVTVDLDPSLANTSILKFTDENDNQLAAAVEALKDFAAE